MSEYDFDVDNCCTEQYGSVWLTDTSLNIGASPHACHVTITTIDDAHKLIAAAQAFVDQQAHTNTPDGGTVIDGLIGQPTVEFTDHLGQPRHITAGPDGGTGVHLDG